MAARYNKYDVSFVIELSNSINELLDKIEIGKVTNDFEELKNSIILLQSHFNDLLYLRSIGYDEVDNFENDQSFCFLQDTIKFADSHLDDTNEILKIIESF